MAFYLTLTSRRGQMTVVVQSRRDLNSNTEFRRYRFQTSEDLLGHRLRLIEFRREQRGKYLPGNLKMTKSVVENHGG